MRMTHYAKRKYGFSLLEILTAITLIAILATILVSVIANIHSRTEASKCVSNLRQIGTAALNWSMDNDGRIVPVFYPGDPDNAASLRNWTGLLAPYMGRIHNTPFVGTSELQIYVCPLRPERFGYAYNYYYLSWIQDHKGLYQWTTMQELENPAKTVLMADSKDAATNRETFSSWKPYLRYPSLAKGLKDSVSAFDHNGMANVLWADGHVSSESSRSAFAKEDALWDRN